MGDRISVSFKNGDEESVCLFSHWGGASFYHEATKYARKLVAEMDGKEMWPLERLEPSAVMVDFIRHLVCAK